MLHQTEPHLKRIFGEVGLSTLQPALEGQSGGMVGGTRKGPADRFVVCYKVSASWAPKVMYFTCFSGYVLQEFCILKSFLHEVSQM